jgi:hypothetical protein
LREIFPEQIQMEWSLDEYRAMERRVTARTLAALDRWRNSTTGLPDVPEN